MMRLWEFGLAIAIGLGCLSKGGGLEADAWYGLGHDAELTVINERDEPCLIHVDVATGERRILGHVPPLDSATWKLPFADQHVRVVACGAPYVFKVMKPARYRVRIHQGARER